MKRIINSDRMSWFRKSFLTKIRKEIFIKKYEYCCHVKSWHTIFICWKDLKEVKENLNSKYIKEYIKEDKYYTCSEIWFRTHNDRLNFLDECLAKFKK
jgi:hypothetical protein